MTDAALAWLLASDEPAVRLLARRDLLREDVADPEAVLRGPMVRALLEDRGVRPYSKWTGAHWRLVSLVSWASRRESRGRSRPRRRCRRGWPTTASR